MARDTRKPKGKEDGGAHDQVSIQLVLDEAARGADRATAIARLLEIDSAEAWTAIGDYVARNEGATTESTIDRLAKLGSPGAFRCLSLALGNPHPLVRGRAVTAIARRRDPSTAPHLLRASRDPDRSVARLAERLLRRWIETSPAVIAEFPANSLDGTLELLDVTWSMSLLAETFPSRVRLAAARRLGALGGEDATQTLVAVLQQADGELADACWSALEASTDVADFMLLPLLVSSVEGVKARAVRIYARFAGRDAAGLLRGLTKDGAPAVRIAAAEGLAEILGAESLPDLEAALGDPDPEVRGRTVALLTRIPESTELLVRIVGDHDAESRRLALTCLANRGCVSPSLSAYYLEFLLKGATHTSLTEVEYLDAIAAAAKAMAAMEMTEGLIAFVALARSVIRRLRRVAIEAIMAYPPEVRGDALHSLMDSEDRDILRNVAFGLHDAGDRRAIEALMRVVLEVRGKPSFRARAALKDYPENDDIAFLTTCLKRRWASVRRYAAEQLKRLRNPEAATALLEASHDEDVEVQLVVVEALQPFAAERADVTARMLELVRNGDISVRQQACESLGEARCLEAVPELIKALHNYFLRPRATQAIKQIGDRKGFLAIKRIERREKLFCKRPKDLVVGRH